MGGGFSSSKPSYAFAYDPTDRIESLTKLVSTSFRMDEGEDLTTIQPKSFKKVANVLVAASRLKKHSNRLSENQLRVSVKVPWILKLGDLNPVSDSFQRCQILGTGLMGTVRLCKIGENYVAIKNIKKSYIQKHNDLRHIQNERDILRELDSKFCIHCFGTFQEANSISFVFEYCVGGELFSHITKRDLFSLDACKFYAVEIFSALEHVHSLGYVYRDLKTENIMIDEYGHCKLIDFGFAVRPGPTGICHTSVGTPAYLAPELLNAKTLKNGYPGEVVDWWGFGVLIFELVTGYSPFSKSVKDNRYEIYMRILSGRIGFTVKFDKKTKDLVASLCMADLSKRLVGAARVKAHPYFSGIDWERVNAGHLVPPIVPVVAGVGDASHFYEYSDKPEEEDETVSSGYIPGF